MLNVTADVDKEKANMVVMQTELREYIDGMLTRYPGVLYELEGEQRQQRDSFGSLMIGWPLLMFTIYILLALPLKSYIQPFIVMSVIPFGFIGAVIGHWIMGYPLSFLSILGLLALSGVVINDSLVLVPTIVLIVNDIREYLGNLTGSVKDASPDQVNTEHSPEF